MYKTELVSVWLSLFSALGQMLNDVPLYLKMKYSGSCMVTNGSWVFMNCLLIFLWWSSLNLLLAMVILILGETVKGVKNRSFILCNVRILLIHFFTYRVFDNGVFDDVTTEVQ